MTPRVSLIRNCGGQSKSVGGFGACSEVPFVLKECNWDTLELGIWIPDHIILTPLNLLYELKKH